MLKVILAIIAIILIPLGFNICEYYYTTKQEVFAINNPNILPQLNPFLILWWKLRIDLYCIVISIMFYLHRIKSKYEEVFIFIIFIGIGITEADIIDRRWNDIRIFTLIDIYMILFNIGIWYFTYYKPKKLKK